MSVDVRAHRRATGTTAAPTTGDDEPSRFRPGRRRRNRIAAGIALGAVGIGGNVLVYSGLDDTEPVVQAVQDLPAGTRIGPEMVRTVDADVDSSVNVVPGDRLDVVVGTYARVRIVSGSLLTEQSLQAEPLVDPANAVVAIRVPEGSLPIGMRERVPVRLVIPAIDPAAPAATVDAEVVGLPSSPDSVLGTQSLSVELLASEAALVAAADDVRVVLLAPEGARE